MLISVTWLSGLALAVRRAAAAALEPAVADHAKCCVELSRIDELALVDGRPTGDQLESAAIARGGPHVGKERLEVAIGRGVHRPQVSPIRAISVTPSSDDDLDDVAIADLVVASDSLALEAC